MLDLDALQNRFSAVVQNAGNIKNVPAALAEVYNDYAKGANVPGADCSAGGDVSLLESAFTTDNTPAVVTNMAAKICAYWDTVPKIGVPVHGGASVVSVVSSFATLTVPMTAAIQACVTQNEFKEPYKRFFSAIETVLKTAPIVITEAMPTTPPTTAPFPEFIK
jgi:hypothetical protein